MAYLLNQCCNVLLSIEEEEDQKKIKFYSSSKPFNFVNIFIIHAVTALGGFHHQYITTKRL